MSPFYHTSFGTFLRLQFADLFTKPSQRTFLLLALGFVLSPTRHTVANYIWRSGAASVKHFTRFYVFLGAPLHQRLDPLWRAIIRLAERYVPDGEPMRLRFDETTAKKSGPRIEGASNYRNGAGTARQEWRTLYGLNFVLGQVVIQLSPWPDHYVSVPIGLALYIKDDDAQELGRVYRRRGELARELLDRVCAVVPTQRRVLSTQDGNYANRYFLRDLPGNASVVGRLPKNSTLYGRVADRPKRRRGPKPKKGLRLGTALSLADEDHGWHPHPDRQREPGAEIRVVEGTWHSVVPGVWLRVVLVRRPWLKQAKKKRDQQRWLEAFFTTDRSLTGAQILAEYAGRWSVEIVILESKQTFGLGQDRCRRADRIEGINALRQVIVAAIVLYVAERVAGHEQVEGVCPVYRPWYANQAGPSLFDLVWAVREELMEQGIRPKVGFWDAFRVIDQKDPPEVQALAHAA